MKYTIYKITNKINGKIYIGKHQTQDVNDNYMGSGKMLRRAQKKYGIENFTKEILHMFDTEEEMNSKERELVTEEFCLREDTYNICVGGQGGFSYINNNGLSKSKEHAKIAKKMFLKLMQEDEAFKKSFATKQKAVWTDERRQIYSKRMKFNKPGFKQGDQHSETSKAKISASKSATGLGNKNSNARPIKIGNHTFSTVREACTALGISDNTLRKRLKCGIY